MDLADRPIRPRLVLASASPRRRSLLAEHGVEHSHVVTGIDDGGLRPGIVDAGDWVAALAYLKARAGVEALPERRGALVLGADTVCELDGSVIGQPSDAEHARSIIAGFAGRAHRVLTGVAVIDAETGARHMLVDEAVVRVGEIDDAEIARYLDSGLWRGKAGAYNLTERLGAGWPIEFDGDPTTIVGLPMRRLVPMLAGLGLTPEHAAA